MVPPEDMAGTARDWLARARGDLALAKVSLPEGGFLEDLCFHAQQASEKAIKAVYRHHNWSFRFVHDVGALLDGLTECGLDVPPDVQVGAELTSFATSIRYPGMEEPVTQQEHAEAVCMAERVVAWAASVIENPLLHRSA